MRNTEQLPGRPVARVPRLSQPPSSVGLKYFNARFEGLASSRNTPCEEGPAMTVATFFIQITNHTHDHVFFVGFLRRASRRPTAPGSQPPRRPGAGEPGFGPESDRAVAAGTAACPPSGDHARKRESRCSQRPSSKLAANPLDPAARARVRRQWEGDPGPASWNEPLPAAVRDGGGADAARFIR